MGVDPTAADAGPGLTRAQRGAIAAAAFVAIFLGSLLLLADQVSLPGKVAVALPLVVTGVTAGLAVVRPGDGWTGASPHGGRAHGDSASPRGDSTSIRRTLPRETLSGAALPGKALPRGALLGRVSAPRAPLRLNPLRLNPRGRAAEGVSARRLASAAGGVWYFLPLLPACVLAALVVATDGDLYGPMKAVLLISTAVLGAVVVAALLRLRPRRQTPAGPVRPVEPAAPARPQMTGRST